MLNEPTWLVDATEGVPGVVLAGLETAVTVVKVITVPAFEARPVDWEHLAAVAPEHNKVVWCSTCIKLKPLNNGSLWNIVMLCYILNTEYCFIPN